jgi:dTDP-glucose 4,6-dehydratase
MLDSAAVRTYLVTGGAGFIGSNLVHQLLREEPDCRVIVLDKLSYAGNVENLESLESDGRFELVRGDICDRALVRTTIERVAPTVILNLAAESHVDRSIDGPAEFVRTNVLGAFEMLDAALEHYRGLPATAKSAFRFVHVSTDEVYGSLGAEGRFTEASRYEPNSPYSATKAGADHLARAYFRTYGLPVVTTNCSNNYGPFQFPEKLVPLVTLNAVEGKPLPVYGEGKNIRDWLFVEDHCHGLRLVAASGVPGETYNLGGNCELTTLDVVHAVCDALEELRPRREGAYRDLVSFVKDRPGHDFRYAIDAAKIGQELGWQPQTAFHQGLRQTVAWYLEHLPWCERASARYQRERLGLGRAS